MHKLLLLSAALVAALPASAQVSPAPILTTPEARDVWTHAQPQIARVTHVAVDLTADFAAKAMVGMARLDILAAPGAKEIVLDIDDIVISAITNGAGQPLDYKVGDDKPDLGAPLTIQLNGATKIIIAYRTGANASALQWLAPEQTAGGKKPYLFSQGQPIYNRSWIPTQDSPGIRQTWDAKITVPKDLVAVMSGERIDGAKGTAAPDKAMRSFRFQMDKPVPIYLLALAVGDLKFKALGPRSGVWTEAPMLEASAKEFVDIERMIDAAEALYGPYRWGRYDMLVLPPAFPYGGMENPTLTFLTPTIITGDRSNTDVVAHELAHSWSGNLVTNATHSDSWLNEGFTTYFENRIMEALYGKERAAMYADLDWDGLIRDIDANGGQTGATTRLMGDPGATAGQLDYFKGSTFLRTIEETVGRERFDAFLRGYFDSHAFQPQTSAGFLTYLRQNLVKGDAALELQLQLDRWVYAAGLPDNAVHTKSETLAAIDAKIAAFNAGGPAADVKPNGWATQQWLRFLNGLPRQQTPARLKELDETLTLSTSNNAYVRSAWYELAIANRYEPALAGMEAYLKQVGRGLLVRPVYARLMEQGDWGKAHAVRFFAAARAGYHPATANGVQKIIEGK